MTRERWEEIRKALLNDDPTVIYTDYEWREFLRMAGYPVYEDQNEAAKNL